MNGCIANGEEARRANGMPRATAAQHEPPRPCAIRAARCASVLAMSLLLAGCATFSDDGGFDPVAAEARSAFGHEARWLRDDGARAQAREQVAGLLAKELSADAAVQVALLNNPRLQAEYANLGISESDLVQAGRLPNPGFTFSKSSGGGMREIERGVHFNVLAILTMPLRVGVQTRRFEAAKLQAAAATLATGFEAHAAWIDAVHARVGRLLRAGARVGRGQPGADEPDEPGRQREPARARARATVRRRDERRERARDAARGRGARAVDPCARPVGRSARVPAGGPAARSAGCGA